MARNDRVLLDGVIDERLTKQIPSNKRDEVFEYLVLEQILKDFDLSNEQLLHGWVDGGRDGGVDGFYILVNGHLLEDPESFPWPRSSSELRVFIVSCKHHESFKQATLDKLIANLRQLLNFELEDEELSGVYSQEVLRTRASLRLAYRKLSLRLTSFIVSVIYASRGDTSIIGGEVVDSAGQVKALVSELFGACESNFEFIGSAELVAHLRRTPNYMLELPFVEALSKGERYVVLAKLSDYYNFVSDNGKLRRYLFESNVRDFMGLNRVNEDIRRTLQGTSETDFWWLNNGVTILANSARIIGKHLQATDIQIVNGLQTTESIFRHLDERRGEIDDRCVLVKVIVSENEEVRDSIVRATNNQTSVELASLHATDKIQRDIEDVLLRGGLFYERRKNFYVNQGRSAFEIITPLYLAAGFVALLQKRPHRAVGLRSKFMRSPEAYAEVFSESIPLEVWPKIATLLKTVDVELERLRPQGRATDRYLKSWRYICSFLIASKKCGEFGFGASDLISLDVENAVATEFSCVWGFLGRYDVESRAFLGWASSRKVLLAAKDFAASYNIAGVEALERYFSNGKGSGVPRWKTVELTDEFVERVRSAMPPQPWKPGINRTVISALGCEPRMYVSAVSRLIDDGIFYRQRDGVLYDVDGSVVGFDSERVDPDTLALL